MDWNALLYAGIGGILGTVATQLGETWRQSREPKKERNRRQRNAISEFLAVVSSIQAEQISNSTKNVDRKVKEDNVQSNFLSYIEGHSHLLIVRASWTKMSVEVSHRRTRKKVDAVGDVLAAIDSKMSAKSGSVEEYVQNSMNTLNNKLEVALTELRTTARDRLR